jgi:hypothetical protein
MLGREGSHTGRVAGREGRTGEVLSADRRSPVAMSVDGVHASRRA